LGQMKMCGNCAHCIGIEVNESTVTVCAKHHYAKPHGYREAFYHAARTRASKCGDFEEYEPLTTEEVRCTVCGKAVTA
jgi:hypothetical protein